MVAASYFVVPGWVGGCECVGGGEGDSVFV